jgi:hypothetical protein
LLSFSASAKNGIAFVPLGAIFSNAIEEHHLTLSSSDCNDFIKYLTAGSPISESFDTVSPFIKGSSLENFWIKDKISTSSGFENPCDQTTEV